MAAVVDSKHVLVIDDDRDHAEVLAMLLRMESPCRFTTDVAFSGQQGIAMAADHAPAIVVLDMQMPGWSGLQTALAFRAASTEPSPMLIAMSGSKEALAAAAAGGAFQHVLVKPLDIRRLLGFLDGAGAGT